MGSEIIIILGNVGRDAEMRYTQQGKAVTSFSVAVNRGDKTTWYSVSAWERLGEICAKYVRKGMTVQVTGTPSARAYIGRDGSPVASLDITARDVQFASRAGDDTDEIPDAYDRSRHGGLEGMDGAADPANGDIPF